MDWSSDSSNIGNSDASGFWVNWSKTYKSWTVVPSIYMYMPIHVM